MVKGKLESNLALQNLCVQDTRKNMYVLQLTVSLRLCKLKVLCNSGAAEKGCKGGCIPCEKKYGGLKLSIVVMESLAQ